SVNGEDHRLDRGAFAASGRESEEFLHVLPVQAEGDEAPAVAVVVEGEMLVDEIDSIAEIREVCSPIFEQLEAGHAVAGRTVDHDVLSDHSIPAVEFHPLEGFVDLTGQPVGGVGHAYTLLEARGCGHSLSQRVSGLNNTDPMSLLSGFRVAPFGQTEGRK